MKKVLLITIGCLQLLGAADDKKIEIICNNHERIKVLEPAYHEEWKRALYALKTQDVEMFQNRDLKHLVNKVGTVSERPTHTAHYMTLLEWAIRIMRNEHAIQALCDAGAFTSSTYTAVYPETARGVTIKHSETRHVPIYYAIMFENAPAFNVLYTKNPTLELPSPKEPDYLRTSAEKERTVIEYISIDIFLQLLITQKQAYDPSADTTHLTKMLEYIQSQASGCRIS